MARRPITYDGCKLARLHAEVTVTSRREAHRPLIQPGLRIAACGIETAVPASLGKNINLGPELRVDEKAESRNE